MVPLQSSEPNFFFFILRNVSSNFKLWHIFTEIILSKHVWLIYLYSIHFLFHSPNHIHSYFSFDPPRPRTNPPERNSRDLVCPIILQQADPELKPEEEHSEDEDDQAFDDIIKIGEILCVILKCWHGEVNPLVWHEPLQHHIAMNVLIVNLVKCH